MEKLHTIIQVSLILLCTVIVPNECYSQNVAVSDRISFSNISDISLSEASDLDIAPLRGVPEKNVSHAIIIANENYKRVPKVPFALNDGRTVHKYFNKCIGIPEGNINLIEDGTLNDINYAINCLELLCKAHPNTLELYIYYAGHGVPNEAGDTYLLPVDGYGSNPESGIKLNDLYSRLNQFEAKTIVVIMDACFSGSRRDGGMLLSTRGITIKPRSPLLSGNMIVLTATTGEETAFPIDSQQHGLFTYELLTAIKESDGEITWGELFEIVSPKVISRSIELTGKTQTPSVQISPSMKDIWKKLKIR